MDGIVVVAMTLFAVWIWRTMTGMFVWEEELWEKTLKKNGVWEEWKELIEEYLDK